LSLILVFHGFKNKYLAFKNPKFKYVVLFVVLSLVTVVLPFSFSYAVLLFVFVAAWVWLIVPLWLSTSVRGKLIIGIFSYPGSIVIGGWPCSLLPGILVIPFGLWYPAPLFSSRLKSIGNIKGYESTFPMEMYFLGIWVVLIGILLTYGFLRKKS
jgi:hypothetical protein